MAEITAVCGKICSGKTFYCRRLLLEKCAVLLSCDELLSECFRHAEIKWHYIDIPDDEWKTSILRRNRLVKAGHSPDYYVDEGLPQKLAAAFEPPERFRNRYMARFYTI